MSATRDRSQKIAFVYSNLYKIYREGVDQARASEPAKAPGLTTSRVLKSSDLTEGVFSVVRPQARSEIRAEPAAAPSVREYRPAELLGGRVNRQLPPRVDAPARAPVPAPVPAPARSESEQDAAIRSLRRNLSSLDELHSRLRFMLKELEELVKD